MHTTDAIDPESLARRFYEARERLAPEHGYETRRDSAVPWEDVPEVNKALMIATCDAIGPLFASVVHDCCVREAATVAEHEALIARLRYQPFYLSHNAADLIESLAAELAHEREVNAALRAMPDQVIQVLAADPAEWGWVAAVAKVSQFMDTVR